MSPPTSSAAVDAVASWVQQVFAEDFGEEVASHVGGRAAFVIRENDISLRVFASLENDDIAQLFGFMSFGQKRTITLLVKQATKRDIRHIPPPLNASPLQPHPFFRQLQPPSGQYQPNAKKCISLPHHATNDQSSQKLSLQHPSRSSSEENGADKQIHAQPSEPSQTPNRSEQLPQKPSRRHQAYCNTDSIAINAAPSTSPTGGTYSNFEARAAAAAQPNIPEHPEQHVGAPTPPVHRSPVSKTLPSSHSPTVSDLVTPPSAAHSTPSSVFKMTPVTPTSPKAVRNERRQSGTGPRGLKSVEKSLGQSDIASLDAVDTVEEERSKDISEEDVICRSPQPRAKRRVEIRHEPAKRFRAGTGSCSNDKRKWNHIFQPTSRQRYCSDLQKEELLVCIVGPSGVGKSSVLNAVLDGYDVLPTSSMRASTAVPIEVRYKKAKQSPKQGIPSDNVPSNDINDYEISQLLASEGPHGKRFHAEIDFITKAEWKNLLEKALFVLQRKEQERRKLQRILTSVSGEAVDDEARKIAMAEHCRSEVNDDSAGTAALAAVKAVLGEAKFLDIEEAKKLCERPKNAAILKHLGQSLRFSFDNCRDVSYRIERFLATSTSRRSAAVWPLVKSARIFGPWKMLSGGMVLVDLPGLQDANSARNQVVAGYIHRCHAIISAARISRARDNKTTHDLLTGPIRAGIESGRVRFVGFIATHSDDVNPAEIVEDLGTSFSRNFGNGLRQAGIFDYEEDHPSIHDIKRQVSKLAALRSASEDSEESDMPNDESAFDRQCQIVELSRTLRSRCILARNGFVEGELKEQFKQEMESLPRSSLPSFRVFCVSSTQYSSIMHDGCAEVSQDFTDVRFTGLPALCDSLWSMSKTTQGTREQGKLDTEAAFRPTDGSDEMIDEAAIENREAMSSFLRSVLQDCAGEEDANAEKIRADMEQLTQIAAAAREDELSDAEKRLQSRSSYLKKLISLNETGAGALLTFLERCKSSSSSVASNRRIEIWFDQARENKKPTETQGATIAILGDSGSGKSSLLNALLDLDGDDVLPVSGVRACTAAPVAITYSGVGGFRAEIEFLGIDEWHDELLQLISDLEEASKKELKPNMPYFERPRSALGRIAYDKIFSVYGRIACFSTLTERSCLVENRLGTTAKLRATSGKGIRQKLEAYCSSRSDDLSSDSTGRWSEAGRLWPLVRVAHLRGPFKILADSGGCLLDLPGLQDSNAARNAVVQSYLGSCSGFIIAAPIKRAVDNRTARELLGRQFRRQLLLDGRISSVAFAATQTDDIDALQVASELGLQGVSSYSGVPESEVKSKFSKHARKIATMRNRIRILAKKKSDLGSRRKKEKIALERARETVPMRAGDEDDIGSYRNTGRTPEQRLDRVEYLDAQLSQVQAAISNLSSELAKREHVLNNICSLARNEYCRIQVREDFVEGIQEITDGAFAMAQNVSSDDSPQLPVFTTSSRDFRHLRQNQTEHAKAFYTMDDTGIPKLFQFVRHNMLLSRINAETKRTERLAVLLSSLSQYLLMDRRATPSQQRALAENIETILNGIDEDVNALASQAMNQLNRILLDGPMKQTLALGSVKARENASSNLAKVEESVHWATYRACLRRLGVYVSPTAGPMNLNESLMAPLMETVIPNWREAFGKGVSKILQNFVVNATKLADTTLVAVAKEVTRSGLSAAPLEGTGELRLLAKKSFDMALSEARQSMEKEFEELQRNCWRELPQSVVQKALLRGYNKANDESGTGCVARLKGHMRYEVRYRRSSMFEKCVLQIDASVKKALKHVSSMTSSTLKTYFVGLLGDIEVLWDSQCDLSREKCVCLANALKNLVRLIEKIGIGSLALEKSIEGVDFDAVDSARSLLPVLDDTLELASLPLIDENMLDSIIPLAFEEEDVVEAGYGAERSGRWSYWAKVKRENELHDPGISGLSQGEPSWVIQSSASEGSPPESPLNSTPRSPSSEARD